LTTYGAAVAHGAVTPPIPWQTTGSVGDPLDATQVALVQRAQAGDMDAFGELYDRTVETVHKFISWRVGDRQLVEDFTADTFLNALRRIDSFTWQGRDFKAWLITIARNRVADYYKSARYRLERTSGAIGDIADREDLDVEVQPDTAVMLRLTRADVRAALHKLEPAHEECLTLRFIEGFSLEQTAAIMGKNEGAIKALQYRATKALGRHIQPKDEQ
jgi:RNA polymerase sigma-70 factor (ECF subfamily)